MEIILILIIAVFIFIISTIIVDIIDKDHIQIRIVKNKYGIILNPIEHFFRVHEEMFSDLKISSEDLITMMPGWYILQFFVRKGKEDKERRTLDQILREKYEREE